MKKIRSRYAPSPTGYLHIGGARTALFAYLYAKHLGGDFVLRIEDTDIERNVVGGEDSQIDNLEWLGIIPDESPRKPVAKYGKYRQSEKLDRYNEIIEILLSNGGAYKAYDTSEELEMQRKEQEIRGIFSFRYDRFWLKISDDEIAKRDREDKYTIRLALKKNHDYTWDDLVRGPITVNTSDIGDYVIKKQDGYPTYNFAVVVDDHDMEISHVLRGEEHVTNTPKQLAVYDLLGWDAPQFGHLTVITNMEGKKLSKRDESIKQFIEQYKNEGYHAHAVFNFLTLLGWTHPNAKEIMPKDEIIKSFDPKRLSKSPSKFDIEKMKWFSKEYIKAMSTDEILKMLTIKIDKDKEWIDLFIDTYKQSAVTFIDIQNSYKIYDNPSADVKQLDEVSMVFAKKILENDFTVDGIKKSIDDTKNETGKKGKDLFMPIRLSATHEEHGPELPKAIYLFGKELIYKRLNIN